MKKIILILLILSAGMNAQNPRGDKIKEIKIAFITEALDLNSAEAEKFWPIYNEHEGKMESIRRQERRDIYKVLGTGIDSITDEEAAALLEKVLTLKTQSLQLEKEFIMKIGKAIPPKKILKLHKAQEDFKRRMLERLKNRRKKN